MSGSSAFDFYTLINSGVEGVAFSPDQSLIYAAKGGDIEVFDVATHALVNSWHVGKDLGAVSVSPDGSFLLAAELQSNGTSKVYKIDAATGAAVSAGEDGSPFLDVQIIDAHTAMLTGGDHNQVQLLNLDTMKYSDMSGGISYSNSSILSHDGHLTLLAETGISDGPLFVYDDRVGQVVAEGDDYQGGSGFNWGAQAISEAAGQIAQFIYYSSIFIYDLDVKFQYSVGFDSPINGIAYDASGKYAYVYLQSGELDKVDTGHWHTVATFNVGDGGAHDHPFADSLMVDSTDSYIVIKDVGTESSLNLIDLSAANGTYKGTAGADAFAGGDGNDIYVVNNAGDTITENANEGFDRVKASINHTLAANVEQLDLSGSAAAGVGNAGDNVINGDKIANMLDGAAGDDLLTGGKGDDQLTGGIGQDTLAGGVGADTLDGGDGLDTASYADAARGVKVDLSLAGAQDTKGGGLDTLIGIENLTGSAYADLLKGGAGPNVLIGGAGDDTLIGGNGIDHLSGGDGSDTFRYLATSDSHGNQLDLITDLTAADWIDLSAIDADIHTKGNQAFTLVDGFSGHAGEAMLHMDSYHTTTLSLDVDGDGVADMSIVMTGDQTAFGNFIL